MIKRLIGVSALVLAMATPAPSIAQGTSAPTVISEYVVQPGDTLWQLAELRLNDPERWRWLLTQNPQLAEPGRSFTRSDGTFVVVIRPGETLRGLAEVGITPTGNNSLRPDSKSSKLGDTDPEDDDWNIPWGWILSLLGGGFLTWLAYRSGRENARAEAGDKHRQEEVEARIVHRREKIAAEQAELNRDPVMSGYPQVPEGLTDATAPTHLQTRVNEDRRNLTILNMTRGRGYGPMLIRYGDGSEHPRQLDGHIVYRATVRDNDSQEVEELYTLQGCGNDIRAGVPEYLSGHGFRFTPDADIPLMVPANGDVVEAEESAAPVDDSPSSVARVAAVAAMTSDVFTPIDGRPRGGFSLKYVAPGTDAGGTVHDTAILDIHGDGIVSADAKANGTGLIEVSVRYRPNT